MKEASCGQQSLEIRPFTGSRKFFAKHGFLVITGTLSLLLYHYLKTCHVFKFGFKFDWVGFETKPGLLGLFLL